MDVDISATLAGLDALQGRIDDATRQATADAAHLFQASAMVHAPVGITGNSTNAPGDLRRSIVVDGPVQIAEHSWHAKLGPTTVYGRQRELGGDIYPRSTEFLRFEKFGEVIRTRHVYQRPEPYMKPAYEDQRAAVAAVVDGRIVAAITGV